MSELSIIVVIAVLVAYGLASRWLERHSITAAMAMVTVGYLLGADVLGIGDFDSISTAALHLAEYTLALMLFWDAARIDLRELVRSFGVPARLLGIGLPVLLLLGFGLAVVLLPGLGLIGAALVAVMLAPTDAALGEVVVSDERIPVHVRQGLDVESGLNDGLAVPLFLVLTDLALDPGAAQAGAVLTKFAAQIGIGALVGAGIGGLGGLLLSTAVGKQLTSRSWGQVVVALLSVSCFLVADSLGGSGFIAAFLGGMAYGVTMRSAERKLLSLTGYAGTMLSGFSFLLLGATLVPLALERATPAVWVYALLSLVVLRPLAVWFATMNGGELRPTVLLMGWFGPRGLATVVFSLLLLESAPPQAAAIATVAIIGATLSVFAHGVTARPFVGAYAGWLERNAVGNEGGGGPTSPGPLGRSRWLSDVRVKSEKPATQDGYRE